MHRDAARLFHSRSPELNSFLEAHEIFFKKPGDANVYYQNPASLEVDRRIEKKKGKTATRLAKNLERKIIKQARRVNEQLGRQMKEYFTGPPPYEDWNEKWARPNPNVEMMGANPDVNIDGGHGRRRRKTATHGRSKRR